MFFKKKKKESLIEGYSQDQREIRKAEKDEYFDKEFNYVLSLQARKIDDFKKSIRHGFRLDSELDSLYAFSRYKPNNGIFYLLQESGRHVEYDYSQYMKLLLKAGGNVNVATEEEGLTPLMMACGNLELAYVKQMIRYGADVNRRDKSGETALHKICMQGDFFMNKTELMEKYSDFSEISEIAKEIAEVLLAHGAELSIKNQEGETALNLVNRYGYKSIGKILAARNTQFDSDFILRTVEDLTRTRLGLDKENMSEGEGITLLERAVKGGADLDYMDEDGKCALFLAVESGKLNLIKFLVENGANINITGKDGENALAKTISPAYMKDHERLVEVGAFLLAHGIDENHVDHEGNTMLHNQFNLFFLHEMGKSYDVEKYTIRNRDGETPFGKLLNRISADAYQPILAKNPDLSNVDSHGNTYFHCAVTSGKVDRIQAMIDRGLDPNALNARGENGILLAARQVEAQNVIEIISLLMEKGNDPLAKSSDDQSAFLFAVLRNLQDVMKFLIAQGEDINQMTKEGLNLVQVGYRDARAVDLNGFIEMGFTNFGPNKEGKTVLHTLCEKERDYQTLRQGLNLLIEQNVETNLADHTGNNELFWLLENNHFDKVENQLLMEMLVKAGVDPRHENQEGESVYGRFAGERDEEIKYLLKHVNEMLAIDRQELVSTLDEIRGIQYELDFDIDDNLETIRDLEELLGVFDQYVPKEVQAPEVQGMEMSKPTIAPTVTSPSKSMEEIKAELMLMKELVELGLITQDDFNIKKKQLLNL